jgi:hypothetical protein
MGLNTADVPTYRLKNKSDGQQPHFRERRCSTESLYKLALIHLIHVERPETVTLSRVPWGTFLIGQYTYLDACSDGFISDDTVCVTAWQTTQKTTR